MKISLSTLADAFEERISECNQYLNIETGEIINVPDSPWVWGQEEYDQLQSLVEEDECYHILPNDYALRDKPIMIDFAYSLESEEISKNLLSQLRRPHPYRCFKDALFRYGIEDTYYAFLHNAYVDIAREWCEHVGVEYSD